MIAASESVVRREIGAFSREAVIAAAALCIFGIAALAVCLGMGFEVGLATSDGTRTTGMHDYAGAFRAERDLTPLVMGVAAASFAASLIITAGSLPQFRRMKTPNILLLGICAVASVGGLSVLAIAMQ